MVVGTRKRALARAARRRRSSPPRCSCRAADKAPADSSASAQQRRAPAPTRSRRRLSPRLRRRLPRRLPRPPHPLVNSAWAVTDSGAGVLRIGMTRDQLALDMHAAVPKHTRADSGCAYLAVPGIPAGMRTMWVAATLARIDIGAPKLPTDRGVSVGDKAAKVEQLYRGSVTVMPAKYDPHGKYLVVKAGPDTTRRIVFETDGATRITRYRVGREPEVEWVEGCS